MKIAEVLSSDAVVEELRPKTKIVRIASALLRSLQKERPSYGR